MDKNPRIRALSLAEIAMSLVLVAITLTLVAAAFSYVRFNRDYAELLHRITVLRQTSIQAAPENGQIVWTHQKMLVPESWHGFGYNEFKAPLVGVITTYRSTAWEPSYKDYQIHLHQVPSNICEKLFYDQPTKPKIFGVRVTGVVNHVAISDTSQCNGTDYTGVVSLTHRVNTR